MQKNTRQPIRVGSLTILLTLVALCLALLAVLSLSTARADGALAQKQLLRLTADVNAHALGEEYLARLDAALAENAALPKEAHRQADGTISARLETKDGRTLLVVAQPLVNSPQRYTLVSWSFLQDWTPDSDVDLWLGA